MPRENIEILAHIAAPGSAADDTGYRTLAQAYIDFEPSARIYISPLLSHDRGDGLTSEAGSQPGDKPRRGLLPLPSSPPWTSPSGVPRITWGLPTYGMLHRQLVA